MKRRRNFQENNLIIEEEKEEKEEKEGKENNNNNDEEEEDEFVNNDEINETLFIQTKKWFYSFFQNNQNNSNNNSNNNNENNNLNSNSNIILAMKIRSNSNLNINNKKNYDDNNLTENDDDNDNNNNNSKNKNRKEEEKDDFDDFVYQNKFNNAIKFSDNLATPILQMMSQRQLSPTVSSITPSNVPFQSSNSSTSSSSSSSSFSSSSSSSSSNSNSNLSSSLSLSSIYSQVRVFISNYVQATISHYRLKYLEGDNDLYYTLRTQPFSSGIYLRGMLISGFNNTLFHIYDLFILITSTNIYSYYHLMIYRLSIIILFFHIIFNLLCVPTRILLHYKCWKNSRVLDSESASVAIQDLIHSNIWIMNRILAWTIDIIAISTLIFGQVFLWFDDNSSPFLTTHILNICSTDILSFLIRLLIAAVYLLSFREFRDNSGIRNRGMSNFDLDRMATFIFTKEDENIYNDCSICLQPYEVNEVLTTLPCHERHCFHASCVKEWLKRQNACPLCQKIC